MYVTFFIFKNVGKIKKLTNVKTWEE